jgi:hypothetical protein
MILLSGLARQLLLQVHDTQKLLERESQLLQQELATLTSELTGWSGKTQVRCANTFPTYLQQPCHQKVLTIRQSGVADSHCVEDTRLVLALH